MKQRILFPSAFLVMLVVLASAELAHAQRLHDPARDAEAQKAAALAEEIVSKGSFEKQLRNLATTERHDFEVYFAGARRQMELDIRTFRTWGNVTKFLNQVKESLATADFIPNSDAKAIADDVKKPCPNRITELGRSICAAKSRLQELQAAVDESERRGEMLDEELKTRLEKIGAIESLVTSTESFLTSDSNANTTISGLAEVFGNIATSSVNFVNKLAQIRNQPSDELQLLLQRIAVETLQLEVDHWKAIGAIKLRRAEEQKELQILAEDVETRVVQIAKCFAVDQNTLALEKITKTFSKALALSKCAIANPLTTPATDIEIPREEILAYLYQTLHGASALAARGETPRRLAELRLAHEEHRFSIRHSAIVARSYEVALTSGTKRLARFYAGGIRPEKIAQLINTAAMVAIPGAISQ
jgi:hypothetical protein